MTTSEIGILISIIVYMVAIIGIGVYYSKVNNSTEDFYLGGRKLGPFVTAMSAEASDMSSWLLMGLPGVAYLTGVCNAFLPASNAPCRCVPIPRMRICDSDRGQCCVQAWRLQWELFLSRRRGLTGYDPFASS